MQSGTGGRCWARQGATRRNRRSWEADSSDQEALPGEPAYRDPETGKILRAGRSLPEYLRRHPDALAQDTELWAPGGP